jgi:hypothetical protein
MASVYGSFMKRRLLSDRTIWQSIHHYCMELHFVYMYLYNPMCTPIALSTQSVSIPQICRQKGIALRRCLT